MYSLASTLKGRVGNNAFAWEERTKHHMREPSLIIPARKDGTLEDVQKGEHIVFEEIEEGKILLCQGLEYFIDIPGESSGFPPSTIFDNHNHALYFWIDAIRKGYIEPGFELIHIDEHSDLWTNEYSLDLNKALKSEQYIWDFTNLSCNVGNYVVPALESRLIGSMVRIENEHEIDRYMSYTAKKNSVLNLDLDIFSPEMDFIPEAKKLDCIRNLMKHVKYATIATSPYFIDQGLAISKLLEVFRKSSDSSMK